MDDKITTIRQELERRLEMCDKTTFKGFVIYAKSYLDFISEVPLLTKICNIYDEKKYKINKNDIKTKFLLTYEIFCRDINKHNQDQSQFKWSKQTKYSYQSGLRYIHDQIMTRLAEVDINTDEVHKFKKAPSLSYDSTNYILHLNKIKIKIGKQNRPTNETKLLKYLFEQRLGDQISYGMILENSYEDFDGDDRWTRCYTAVLGINEKIQRETNYKINDFLERTTGKNGYVEINQEYLPTF